VLSQDVADNSLGTLVRDAIYSIARSPVFAQRHEVAIYVARPLNNELTLGTLAMLGAILP
jgi:hypothetical protein